jgi:hypothetical protein
MPSKGYSGDSQAQPLAQVLAAAIGGPSATPAPAALATETPAATPALTQDLDRPLQRDTEVSRFNELVARQDSLTPEESNELHQFRIRRLQTTARRLRRATLGWNEAELAEALDQYRRRLTALRGFEELLRAAGQATEYVVDPASEQAAEARHIEMQERRPHGLICGTGDQPHQSSGAVRVSGPDFSTRQDDVPIVLLVPETTPHEQLAAHVEELRGQGAKIRVTTDPGEVTAEGPPSLVINWGSDRALPQDVVALNRPEAVRTASDQVECLRRLGELAPRTVVNPQDIGLLGTDAVVAKRRSGMRGRGKRVLSADAPASERAGYDLFQEFVPERREYRVTLLNGRVVSAHWRQPADGTPADQLNPDWTYERLDALPRSVARVAREAGRRVGLDLAGVDVVEDLGTGRVLCLEANSAPGMSAETLRSLYGGVQQLVRGRFERAR